MINYAIMYEGFDDKRLLEMVKNLHTIVVQGIDTKQTQAQQVLKAMYATEVLKDRGVKDADVWQAEFGRIGEKNGLFTS